jgi:hypothetical protein
VKLTTHLHLVPTSKNEWIYTSIPQYAFMAWCSVKHRGNFTFAFTFIGEYLQKKDISPAKGIHMSLFMIKEYQVHQVHIYDQNRVVLFAMKAHPVFNYSSHHEDTWESGDRLQNLAILPLVPI